MNLVDAGYLVVLGRVRHLARAAADGGIAPDMTEARLEDAGSGLAPVTPGWFVVNVEQAAWVDNDAFGARCVFESSTRVLAERPDLEPQWFEQVGITLTVIQPGKPSGLYHGESAQEDFLVLAGECVALIEGEERPLRRWDFVHCPPGTVHSFVGAGTVRAFCSWSVRDSRGRRSSIRARSSRCGTTAASRRRRPRRGTPMRRSPAGGSAGRNGRSWIRTTDLRLIRAAL